MVTETWDLELGKVGSDVGAFTAQLGNLGYVPNITQHRVLICQTGSFQNTVQSLLQNYEGDACNEFGSLPGLGITE